MSCVKSALYSKICMVLYFTGGSREWDQFWLFELPDGNWQFSSNKLSSGRDRMRAPTCPLLPSHLDLKKRRMEQERKWKKWEWQAKGCPYSSPAPAPSNPREAVAMGRDYGDSNAAEVGDKQQVPWAASHGGWRGNVSTTGIAHWL